MRTKVLIVDDEKLARDRLRRFLSEAMPDCKIEESPNGMAALERIKIFKPQIVFLDIQMPGLNGFEVLQQIEERNFQVIFQTAYDEFAIRAFDENACDYLLKPFTIERLKKSLAKALMQSGDKALEDLEKKIPHLERIAIKQNGKTKIIEADLIDYFISRDHYTCIFVGKEESVCDLSLSWLAPRLDPDKFIRIHRNAIVAINRVKAVGSTSDSRIELRDGTLLALSRHNRRILLAKISDLPC